MSSYKWSEKEKLIYIGYTWAEKEFEYLDEFLKEDEKYLNNYGFGDITKIALEFINKFKEDRMFEEYIDECFDELKKKIKY